MLARLGRTISRRRAVMGHRKLRNRNAETARERVDRRDMRNDADDLHILAVGNTAGEHLPAPAAGQTAGIGDDPMNCFHPVFRQSTQAVMAPGDGIGRQGRLAAFAKLASRGMPGLFGDRDTSLGVEPSARPAQPIPCAPMSLGQIAANHDRGIVYESVPIGCSPCVWRCTMIRHIRRAAPPDRQSTRWSRPRDGASIAAGGRWRKRVGVEPTQRRSDASHRI